MLNIQRFVFSMFGVNTYLLTDQATGQAAVIDPAMSAPDERKAFDKILADNNLTQIINTHLHLDHCFGLNYVKTKYGVPVKAHAGDAPLGENMPGQYRRFGLNGDGAAVSIDVPLKDGDTISVGDSQLSVIHVPGHSPGGIALYYKEGNVLFSGDTLFQHSIGRTDLVGGDQAQLISSIREKLFTLPGDTVVLPGHGDPTTIDEELRFNPYV